MKLARKIMIMLTIVAITGGIFAFKIRYNSNPSYYTTTNILVGTITYHTTVPFCLPNIVFITNSGQQIVITLRTTSPLTKSIILTSLGRTHTLIVPQTCVVTNTFTTLDL